jgi:hypothetical protein
VFYTEKREGNLPPAVTALLIFVSIKSTRTNKKERRPNFGEQKRERSRGDEKARESPLRARDATPYSKTSMQLKQASCISSWEASAAGEIKLPKPYERIPGSQTTVL